MDDATLILGIREHFMDGLQHTEILVPDKQTNPIEATFFQPYEEVMPAFVILPLVLDAQKFRLQRICIILHCRAKAFKPFFHLGIILIK